MVYDVAEIFKPPGFLFYLISASLYSDKEMKILY